MTKTEKQMLFEINPRLLNYINVSKRIDSIPYSRYRYDYILSTSPVNIGLVEDKVVDVVEDESSRPNDYLLCTISERTKTTMYSFFSSFKATKIIVYHLIESFSDILDSMILLNKANICWFDFTPDSIGFGNGSKPILRYFDNSILLDNDFSITLKEILKNVDIDDFTYKPIEVHLLYYLLMNKEPLLNAEVVEIVKTNFAAMNKLEIAALGYIDKYIGYSMDDVISDMKPNTWDSYIFCSMYIDLLRQIDHMMFPKNEIITNFILALSKCNQIDPEKRASLNDLKDCCYQVKRNCKKWGFVNHFL
jgi:hypothetical protein